MAHQSNNHAGKGKESVLVSLWEQSDWKDEHYNEIADAAARCFEREFAISQRCGKRTSGPSSVDE